MSTADSQLTRRRLLAAGAGGAVAALAAPDLLHAGAARRGAAPLKRGGTLTVTLEQPDSVFLYLLGLPFTSIVPRDVVERLGDKQFGLKPVGTGPFKMTSADPTRHVTLERNTAYWNPPRPYADRVEWNI